MPEQYETRQFFGIRKLALWAFGSKTPEGSPNLEAAAAPDENDPDGSMYFPVDNAQAHQVKRSGTWEAIALVSDAASTVLGKGASLVGVSAWSGTASNVQAALAELYTLATTATSDSFTDTNSDYPTDTVGAALVALGVALGGTDVATRDFTSNGVVLTDDEPLFDSLDALNERFSITEHVGGSIPTFHLLMANQPADTNTIDVGGDVYEFVDEAVNTVISADTNIAVTIGVSAAATRTNLIAAINADNGTNLHATITLLDTVTPAVANGTETYFATEVGTTVRFQLANAAGGMPTPGLYPTLVLAEAITDAADVWDCGDVDIASLGLGQPAGMIETGMVDIVVNAGMIASGFVAAFPFTPVSFTVQVMTSAGVLQGTTSTDTYAIVGDTVVCTLGGGIAPDAQATDTITIRAWSAPV